MFYGASDAIHPPRQENPFEILINNDYKDMHFKVQINKQMRMRF